ncbi:hypothetical protein AB8P76_10385 [Pseudomonas aeruginosa]|uniref:hypothetical protein n=1 Tax=Pseudomonadota TaxID=1224 RepID=UPI002C94E6E9|nr:hypothetical protein [Thauera sp.]HRP23014.1 hypothetical protein [Thauera sp.]
MFKPEAYQLDEAFLREVNQALDAVARELGGVPTLKKQFASHLYFERKTVFDVAAAAYNAARKVYPYDVSTKVARYIAMEWPKDPEVVAHLLAMNEGFESGQYTVSKSQFFDFVCRCIEDISKGRMAKERRQTIVELATLLCQVQGWKFEEQTHEK